MTGHEGIAPWTLFGTGPRGVLEKEIPPPEAAMRVLENVETILRQAFPNEPAEKLREKSILRKILGRHLATGQRPVTEEADRDRHMR